MTTTSPTLRFRDSIDEVGDLLIMHEVLTGTKRGRRHRVQVLNKSAIIFLCAAFEAFIEDLAGSAFAFLVSSSPDPAKLPTKLRKGIAEALREDKNELKVWELAGDGWKTVAERFRIDMHRKHVGPFNTPKPGNIENLIRDLLGLEDFCSKWVWTKTTAVDAKDKLRQFVELRGALAHGAKPAPVVRKDDVKRYLNFLGPLSVRMSNEVRAYCHTCTGSYPWSSAVFGRIK